MSMFECEFGILATFRTPYPTHVSMVRVGRTLFWKHMSWILCFWVALVCQFSNTH
jgi:hypothetical protein